MGDHLSQPQTDLAKTAPGLADVQPVAPSAAREAAELIAAVVVIQRELAPLDLGISGHEQVAAQTLEHAERVAQFAEKRRGLADLHEVVPFGAARIQPAPCVRHLDVEGTVTAEVGEQVEPDAKVMRPPRLFFQIKE